MTSTDLLAAKEMLHAKLYDIESMMELKKDVAAGFVVLLNGGPLSPKSSSKVKDANNNNENRGLLLAFMSLTSGNVIDACFGVENPSIRNDTPASRSAQEAKTLLDDRDTTDSFRDLAVTAYCGAFEAVVIFNEQMDNLNCITKCFRSKTIRDESKCKIRAAFSALVMAIGDSN